MANTENEERARILEAAAHCLHAAAHLILISDPISEDVYQLIKQGIQLAKEAA